jgi:hypothetical protein
MAARATDEPSSLGEAKSPEGICDGTAICLRGTSEGKLAIAELYIQIFHPFDKLRVKNLDI